MINFCLHFDGPGLLFNLEYVGRNPAHVARKNLVRKGVERYSGRHAGTDPRRVDFIDGSADIQATAVNQINRRRRWHPDRRRRYEFTHFAIDLGNYAAERRLQYGPLQGCRDHVDSGIADPHEIAGRLAARFFGFRIADRTISFFFG